MGAAMDLETKKLAEIKKLLIGLAQYRQISMRELPLQQYAEDLMDLDLLMIGNAVKKIRSISEYKPFAALVGLIRETISLTVKDEALDAANRILVELGKNQSGTHLQGEEYEDFLAKKREAIGELGWEAVKRLGGWAALYREFNDSKPGVLRAQLTQLCETIYRKSERGLLNEAPKLVGGQQQKAITAVKGLIGQVTKSIKEER